MKVNRLIPWSRRFRTLEHGLHSLPFLLVGGRRRASRWLASQLVVHRFRLTYPNLPRAWDGLTVAHLSDLHIGPFFTVAHHFPSLIQACVELNSDLICVTGDWIDYTSDPLPEALTALAQIKPALGWYGCLGNHEYHENRWRTLRILRTWLGRNLLVNDLARLTQKGESIDLVGLDFSTGGRRLRRGLRSLAARWPERADFSIGLVHYPDVFDELRRWGINLMLSGHTHGGQICWTSAPEPAVGPAAGYYQYPRGLYEKDQSKLYVSCGLGATVPVRINCPPEVTQFTLVRG